MHRTEISSGCAYCDVGKAETSDHVVPRALYPPSKKSSRVQRVTVPACLKCNNGWSGDEPHFRDILLLSGEATPAVRELWAGKTRRSFAQLDGRRRLRDLVEKLVPMEMPEGERHMIYPGRDPRVMRVVRKVIRGLSHHHRLRSPLSDAQVWADVQQFLVPPQFDAGMTQSHVEEDVLQYQFWLLDDDDFHTCWVLRFFNRTAFFGIVYQSELARSRLDAANAHSAAS
jgi:hypothetical protein